MWASCSWTSSVRAQETPTTDLVETAVWDKKSGKLCMDPKTLLRASYMYKECETRVDLLRGRTGKEMDAERDACKLRLEAMEAMYRDQLATSRETCDDQLGAVTKQVDTVMTTMSESYAKKVNALTKLNKPDRTWHIVGGVVGGAVAIGLGILIGYVIPR